MKYVPEKQLYQYDQGVYIIVPDEYRNCTAQFYSKSFPDGLAMENEILNGKIMCQIPNQMLVNAESIIVYAFRTGTNIMITESLSKFSVTARPKPPDFVLDPTDTVTYKTASDLIADMQTAKSEEAKRVTAESLRASAEIERASSETVRKATETERVNAESERAVAETARSAAETARANAETSRSKAESSREVAEQSRANAESERETAEQNRANAESLRVEAEFSRKAAEQDRANAESDRASAEQLRAAAETERAEFYEGFNSELNSLKSDLTGLQTAVDSKADKTDLAKTNLYLDALYKLNKGQTHDVLEQESEAYSVDVPSGSHYVGVDKVGGKSVVWNQKFDIFKTYTSAFDGNHEVIDNKLVYKSYADVPANRNLIQFFNNSTNDGHKYYASAKVTNNSEQSIPIKWLMDVNDIMKTVSIKPNETVCVRDIKSYNYTFGIRLQRDNPAQATDELVFEDIMFCDLTQMFGAGNEPSTVEEFEAMFPNDYYPYSEPTIISSQTDRVDVRGKNLLIPSDNFPITNNGVTFTRNYDGTITCNGTSTGYPFVKIGDVSIEKGVTYTIGEAHVRIMAIIDGKRTVINSSVGEFTANETYDDAFVEIALNINTTYNNLVVRSFVVKGTNGSYSPYSLQQITTGFPVLNSAGSVYDYIDLNEGKLHQNVAIIDLGELIWHEYGSTDEFKQYYTNSVDSLILDYSDGISDKYKHSASMVNDSWYCANDNGKLYVRTNNPISGTLYCIRAEELITDIEITTELTDWIEVETGGTITFHNADDGKRLLVPNKLSFVRKLDEVTV